MAEMKFLGFKEVSLEAFAALNDSQKIGYIWFVGGSDAESGGDIYLGCRHYGQYSSASTVTKEELVAAFESAITASEVSISSESGATSAILKTYKFIQNGKEIGEIDLPKDFVVISGEVVENPYGQPEGTYIKLVIANQDEPIYINVEKLVNIYAADETTITKSDANIFSVKENVFDSYGAAESVKTEVLKSVEELSATVETIASSAVTDVLVNGESVLEDSVAKVNVDTEALVLTKGITVEGGPWAEEVKAVFGTTLKSGLTMQEFLEGMLTQEYWGEANATYVWNVVCDKPSIYASETATALPVGTIVILSAATKATTATESVTVSGMTYGYSLDGESMSSTAKTYTDNKSKAVILNGDAIIETTTVGFSAVTDVLSVSGNTAEYYVVLGTNTYTANVSGQTATAVGFDEASIYPMSNLGNVSSAETKIEVSKFEGSVSTPTNSNKKTITGYYPIYYGQTNDVSLTAMTTEDVTAGTKSQSIPSSVTIKQGTGTYFIAVPSSSTIYSKDKMVLITDTKDEFGKSQISEITIDMLNNLVIDVPYKVFFISNALGWPEASTAYNIKFE